MICLKRLQKQENLKKKKTRKKPTDVQISKPGLLLSVTTPSLLVGRFFLDFIFKDYF